jgi:hypothetical protein
MRRRLGTFSPLMPTIALLLATAVPAVGATGGQFFVDETAARLPADADYSRQVDLVDVDGDGDLDAFITNSARGAPDQSRLYINDGAGYFTDETASLLPIEFDDTRHSTFADFDGDGALDVFIGAASGDPCRLWMNDGTGFFADESGLRLPSFSSTVATEPKSGDLDGDGDFDILVPGFGARSRLLINDGAGFFTEETELRLPGVASDNDRTSGFVLFDFDFDSDLDIFEGNALNSDNRLLVNDGHGFFVDESADRIPIDYHRSHVGRNADYDGDDRIDVVICNASSVHDQIWMNRGGIFEDESSIRFPDIVRSTYNMDTADIDNDGWFDLVFANSFTTTPMQNLLFRNTGGGYFEDVTAERMPPVLGQTQRIRFGDVDGDGDVDIFETNMDEQNRLYINNGTPDVHAPRILPPVAVSAMLRGLGPFPITAHVLDNVSVNIGEVEVSVLYRVNGDGDFIEVPADWRGGELYVGEIPKQTQGTRVSYYIQAIDRTGNVSTLPDDAPARTFGFTVGGLRFINL